MNDVWCDVCNQRKPGVECPQCVGRVCAECAPDDGKCPFCGASTQAGASCSRTGGCGDGRGAE